MPCKTRAKLARAEGRIACSRSRNHFRLWHEKADSVIRHQKFYLIRNTHADNTRDLLIICVGRARWGSFGSESTLAMQREVTQLTLETLPAPTYARPGAGTAT